MDFWSYMLGKEQGGGGSGGGGKSKVIYINDAEELTDPAEFDYYGKTYIRVSHDVPTIKQLTDGVIGSHRIDGETLEFFFCYPIVASEEEMGEMKVIAVDAYDEIGIPGCTVLAGYNSSNTNGYTGIILNAEAAEIVSALFQIEVTAGIWINADWMLAPLTASESGAEFALAYTVKGTVVGDSGGGGAGEWIGDGNTHIWIELSEERKSPIMGMAVNGTVTIDWGDGSAPDTLTGTSSTYSDVLWTPRHEYAKGGEYVITVTVVEGQVTFAGSGGAAGGTYLLRNSTSDDGRNHAYRYAIKRVELGSGILTVATTGLGYCHNLREVKLPDSMVIFGGNSLAFCRNLERFIMHSNGSTLGSSMFSNCENLKEVVLAETLASIPSSTFSNCSTLTYIKIPAKVSNVASGAFQNCYSMKVYDFTDHSAVPTLGATSAFTNIPADCEIRVPAALAEDWKAASNWSTYADRIVGV